MFGTRIMTAGAWRAAFRNVQPSQNPSLRQAAATFGRRQASGFSTSVPGLTSQQVMWRVGVGMGAAAGVLGVCMMGEAAADKSAMWPDYVQQRVSATYGWFASSLAVTAASTVVMIKTGAFQEVMHRHPIMFSLGSLAAVVACGYMCINTDIHQNKPLKLAYWGLGTMLMGTMIAPFGFLAGGPLMMKAAAYTGATVGALSLVAMASRDDKFLWMGGMLTMGLMVVVVTSFGRILLPAHYFVAHSVMENICMYGGTAVFSGMILYKSNRVVQKAKYQQNFDALNASLGIYISTINLFQSILQILMSRKR